MLTTKQNQQSFLFLQLTVLESEFKYSQFTHSRFNIIKGNTSVKINILITVCQNDKRRLYTILRHSGMLCILQIQYNVRLYLTESV